MDVTGGGRKPILLGVIPARGGSKGLKSKNLRRIDGKPLIAYTIGQASKLARLFATIVTTDSEKVASVARRYGAAVPFMRPRKLAGDRVGMLPVLEHAVRSYEKEYPVLVEGVVLLDPTSPARKEKDVRAMVRIFRDRRPDLLVGVKPARRTPYMNMLKMTGSGYAALFSRSTFVRRQDAPPTFDITNSCWIFSRTAVFRHQRIPRKTMTHPMTGPFVDIDSLEDCRLFAALRSAGLC